MLRTIPTILTALALAACLSAQDEKPGETRRYDIRAITAALTETSSSFQFTAAPNRPGGAGEASVRYLWSDQETTEPDHDAVANIVSFAMRADVEPDKPRDRVSASEGRLTVSGPPRFHEQVPRILAELHRVLAPTIEVELSILPPEALAATSSAVLDAAKVQRLLEVAKPLATMRTHLRPGSETLFEAVARRAYVKDYDTQVAQDSKASDPLIDVIPEGARISVRVDRTPSGAFVVAVRGQAADPNGPARTHMLNYQTPAVLQLPRIWWASTSASARIEDRGALVIGNDVTPRAVWVVRVFAPATPITTETPSLRLVPITAATREPMESFAPVTYSPNPSGSGAGMSGRDERHADRHRVDPDLLMGDVHTLGPESVPEAERRALKVAGFIALDGDRRFVSSAEALLTKLVEDATRGHTIEVRFGSVPSQGPVMPAPDELETIAVTLSHRAVTAAVAGDRVVLIAGEAHSYLKDRDTEIAQAMTVDDPIVDVFFTGLSMSCQVLPAAPGRCSAEVRFEYQELIELASVATGSKEVPETELPRIASVHAFVPLDVALGSWTLAHLAPLEGTNRQLLVMIRVIDG